MTFWRTERWSKTGRCRKTLLKDELLFQRGNADLPVGAAAHQHVGWRRRSAPATTFSRCGRSGSTPGDANSDVINAMSYLDVGRDGPRVFEAPPGLQGILLDFCQRPMSGSGEDGVFRGMRKCLLSMIRIAKIMAPRCVAVT